MYIVCVLITGTLQSLLKLLESFIRRYRKYHKRKPQRDDPSQPDAVKEDDNDTSDSDDDDNKRKPEYRKPWRESTVAAPVIDSDVKIGEIYSLMYIIIMFY